MGTKTYAYDKSGRWNGLLPATVNPDGSVMVQGIGIESIPATHIRSPTRTSGSIVVLRPVAVDKDLGVACPGALHPVALEDAPNPPIAFQACGVCTDCREAHLPGPIVAVWKWGGKRFWIHPAKEVERYAHRIAARGGDPAFEAAITARHLQVFLNKVPTTPESLGNELERAAILDKLGETAAGDEVRCLAVSRVLEAIATGAPEPTRLAADGIVPAIERLARQCPLWERQPEPTFITAGEVIEERQQMLELDDEEAANARDDRMRAYVLLSIAAGAKHPNELARGSLGMP